MNNIHIHFVVGFNHTYLRNKFFNLSSLCFFSSLTCVNVCMH